MPTQTVQPGILIAIEGIDGAGTTTQAERLTAALGAAGHLTREPSRGPVGLLLRQLLGGAHAPVEPAAIALLFAADRLDHLQREVEPALARGLHVVTDRYVLSSLAYQSVDVARGWVAALNQRARSADLTLFVDVPVEIAEARRKARGGPEELFDRRDFQERVVAAYRREAAALSDSGAAIVTLDGARAPDEVHREIAAAVQTCLRARLSAS